MTPPGMSIGPLARYRFAFVAIACTCLLATATTAGAQAALTVSWDRSPDAHATGYYVYVGTEPGVYADRYDAGNATSFAITSGSPGPFYVAVAAYTLDGVVGPRSAEVSTIDGAQLSSVEEPAEPQSANSDSPQNGGIAPAPERLCDGSGQRCFLAQEWARTAEAIHSISVAPDARVFAVQRTAEIRVATEAGLVETPALSATADERFDTVVVDPAFLSTHYVFASRIGMRPDGTRDLSIVRYREVANRLGEAATLITELPLPPEGQAPFTVDASGHVYIAMPAWDGNRDPYAATILRFDRDGRVPAASSSTSPVIATGISDPVSLVWDRAGRLWLTGRTTSAEAVLAHVSLLPVDSGTWPLPAAVTHLGGSIAPTGVTLPVTLTSASQYAMSMPDALYRWNHGAVESYAAGALGKITALAGAADGTLFVVVQPIDQTGSRLLELRPETR